MRRCAILTWLVVLALSWTALAQDVAPEKEADLVEVIEYYPLARAQVDTLTDEIAWWRAECTRLQADSSLIHFKYQSEIDTRPAWYDRFVPGYLVGAAATVFVVWGLQSL